MRLLQESLRGQQLNEGIYTKNYGKPITRILESRLLSQRCHTVDESLHIYTRPDSHLASALFDYF